MAIFSIENFFELKCIVYKVLRMFKRDITSIERNLRFIIVHFVNVSFFLFIEYMSNSTIDLDGFINIDFWLILFDATWVLFIVLFDFLLLWLKILHICWKIMMKNWYFNWLLCDFYVYFRAYLNLNLYNLNFLLFSEEESEF